MKKYVSLFIVSLFFLSVYAQVPEDVLKYGWQPVNGTARIMAIGGASGSLGGDISTVFTNPAGLGFYKTADFVISPGYSFLTNKSNFRGTDASNKAGYFNLGPTGIVFGDRPYTNSRGKRVSNSLGLSINRVANFKNKIYYTGQNDFSSYGEQFAAEAASSNLSIDDILNGNAVSLATRMALYSYLVDTTTLPGNATPDFVSLAMYDKLKNMNPLLLNQSHTIETSGGITELALGFSKNVEDKIYYGLSFGVSFVNYKKKSFYSEQDATGRTNNYFDFSELDETFKTTGYGLNLKFGVIAKPAEQVRIGVAVHTPNWFTLKDSYTGVMRVNTENYRTNPGTETVSSDTFTGGETPTYQYFLFSPWKFMLSGSYVLREVEDVTKQRGFLTADVEYVTHRSNRFSNAEEYDDGGYYKSVNNGVKDYYKGALNFRVGGELKFTTFMTRLGFSYYGNPYRDSQLKGDKMFLSGGLGYRKKGMFIDVTYIHGIIKDISFPYRLPDKANTYADINGKGGNIMMTVGFKI